MLTTPSQGLPTSAAVVLFTTNSPSPTKFPVFLGSINASNPNVTLMCDASLYSVRWPTIPPLWLARTWLHDKALVNKRLLLIVTSASENLKA